MTTTTVSAEIRDRLAHDLMPLVHEVAGQVARRVPSHVMLEDLVGAGLLGLAGALQRYDPERAETFKGYAEFRIRGAIMDDLRRRDIMSRDARIETKKLDQTVQKLRMALGREPDDDEVCACLGVDLQTYRTMQLRLCNARLVPMDNMELPSDGDCPTANLDHEEMRQKVADAIRRLPKRQQTVLWLYYFKEQPLRQIADLLGVSPSRICQIRTEAVAKIRRMIHEEMALAA